MKYTYYDSQVGRLLLAGDTTALRFLSFTTGRRPLEVAPDWRRDATPFAEVGRQLDLYFAGELRRFDLRLEPSGTEFQRSVWLALAEIPYGETVSYGELARRVGRPKASRAVGAANGSNPVAIILPCHRVIGSSGRLTGYGGGLHVKEALLELERRHSPGAQARLDLT